MKTRIFPKQIPSKDVFEDITNAISTIYALSPKQYKTGLFRDLAVGFKSLIYAMEQDQSPQKLHSLFIKWLKLYVWLQHRIDPNDQNRSKLESKIPVCTSYILASLQYQNSIANYHQNIMEMCLSLFESALPVTMQNIANLDIEIIAQLWMPIEFVGDYISQRLCLKLIVAVLKHLSEEQRRKKILQAKLNQELQSLILKLVANPTNFEPISRELLNKYNTHFARNCTVFSVYCTKALFGRFKLFKPENVTEFWIDFNYTSKSVSLLCQVNQSKGNQEMCIKIKIEKLRIVNQFNCSVYSVEPATFSTEASLELKTARIAVFTLPKTEVERLEANSDLFDYYNNFTFSQSSIAPTPNTIEKYLNECSQDSPQTEYSFEESPNIKSPMIPVVKLHKLEMEDQRKDSTENEKVNCIVEKTPTLTRTEEFVNDSIHSNRESGYNTYLNTTAIQDSTIFKKPAVPIKFKTKKNVKPSFESIKIIPTLKENTVSEASLTPQASTKNLGNRKRKTRTDITNAKNENKKPANKEDLQNTSGISTPELETSTVDNSAKKRSYTKKNVNNKPDEPNECDNIQTKQQNLVRKSTETSQLGSSFNQTQSLIRKRTPALSSNLPSTSKRNTLQPQSDKNTEKSNLNNLESQSIPPINPIFSQQPLDSSRRFFKTGILSKRILAAKAKPKSRKKRPNTSIEISPKTTKCINRVKPLNFQNNPDSKENVHEINTVKPKTAPSVLNHIQPQNNGTNANQRVSRPTKRRTNKKKSYQDDEVFTFVPYSTWKINQKEKKNSESTMLSSRQEPEDHRTAVELSTNQDQPSIISLKTKQDKIIRSRTESSRPPLSLFDQLKQNGTDIESAPKITKSVPWTRSCDSRASSISNGNFIMNESDSENEATEPPLLARYEQSEDMILSPVNCPIEVVDRSSRPKSRESTLTHIKMSLDDGFNVLNQSQRQEDSSRLLQNPSTSFMSPVYENLVDEIPLELSQYDSSQLPTEALHHKNDSKGFSYFKEQPQSVQVLSPFSNFHQLELPPEVHTKLEELSLLPTNNEWQITDQQPTSSRGSPISVFSLSEDNEEENSSFAVHNFTNQIVFQSHYIVATSRKRIYPSACEEATPAKMTDLTLYKPPKGFDQLIPNYIKKFNEKKEIVLKELEKHLNTDILESFNKKIEAVTKSITCHKTKIQEVREKVSSLLEKLEWHQRGLQDKQAQLECIYDQFIRYTQTSFYEEGKISEVFKKAEEDLKTSADVLKRELWQEFQSAKERHVNSNI